MNVLKKKASTSTTSNSTTSLHISLSTNLTNTQCLYGWGLFQGGMNLSQAEAEGGVGKIAAEGVSGYWYKSNMMSLKMCISSCLKYGFIMAAKEP